MSEGADFWFLAMCASFVLPASISACGQVLRSRADQEGLIMIVLLLAWQSEFFPSDWAKYIF